MSQLLDWLDHRIGYRDLVNHALYEHVPGGARWRYVWGSTLVFAFVTQVVTGVILWAAYSPSSQTAWESVYYIQHQMTGGWLLRGVHHFMSQAMIVLLALHFVQVVVDGAYRAPREFNFWLGLILMQIVLGLALTGYLLPWDQKGFWATKVATNMIALVPVVGQSLQKLVVGGDDYGHHTLTRFFALHAGVLPALLSVFLALHIYVFRRHGLKPREPLKGPDSTFWPDQILRDAVACLGVMIVVLVLVLRTYPTTGAEMPPGERFGAELGAPANPAENYSAARPETYFLFLFQLLKYLDKFPPIVGAIIVPGFVMFTLFLMPFVGRWELGHRFVVVWTMALLVGAGVLTGLAWREDHNGSTEHSRHYLAAVANAEAEAERTVQLAGAPTGIPPTGALELLRSDPKIQGPKLFREHCAACHSHAAPGNSADPSQQIVVEKPTAANLWGFGGREWVAGLLDPTQIDGPNYFGNTAHKEGEMVKFVQEKFGAAADPNAEGTKPAETAAVENQRDSPFQPTPEQAERLEKHARLKKVDYALAAEAGQLREQFPSEWIAEGRDAIVNTFECTNCHKFHDDGALGSAPDLTGWGSREWLIGIISNPEHERFYPSTNDHMPAFAKNPDDPAANRLSPSELSLLVNWLRGDWYEPHAEINPPAPESAKR